MSGIYGNIIFKVFFSLFNLAVSISGDRQNIILWYFPLWANLKILMILWYPLFNLIYRSKYLTVEKNMIFMIFSTNDLNVVGQSKYDFTVFLDWFWFNDPDVRGLLYVLNGYAAPRKTNLYLDKLYCTLGGEFVSWKTILCPPKTNLLFYVYFPLYFDVYNPMLRDR